MVAGWTTATISQVVTINRWLYTAGIRPPSATRDKVTVSVVLQRMRALALYTITIDRMYDSKA